MTGHRGATTRRILPAVLLLVVLAAVAGCGGGNSEEQQAARGTAADRAFLSGMVPHHRSAVEMAALAPERARRREIKRLGEEITSAQNSEVKKMEEIHQRLFAAPLRPDEAAHEGLGLSPEEAGMEQMDGAKKLRTAKPFDRAFIDEMIPHHQGAIRMARAVMGATKDAEVRTLAEGIVAAQTKEIEQMNGWRKEWYGAPSPAGGVPSEAQPTAEPGAAHNAH